jgi:hypothetical protein
VRIDVQTDIKQRPALGKGVLGFDRIWSKSNNSYKMYVAEFQEHHFNGQATNTAGCSLLTVAYKLENHLILST